LPAAFSTRKYDREGSTQAAAERFSSVDVQRTV
jgi:hypothetical protein